MGAYTLKWVPLLGGAMALGHKPGKKLRAQLQLQGCGLVVNLLSHSESRANEGPGRIRLPMAGAAPPDPARRAEFEALFEQIRRRLEGGERVYVHCSAGLHRTGMAAYAMLRSLGYDRRRAVEAIREMRALTASELTEERMLWGDDFARPGATMVLDHVAVLTTDIEGFCAANRLSSQEPVEVFADVGSRELYVDGDDAGARLLLLQAHGEGPYRRAMAKRGAGLHHLGVAVSDLAAGLAAWTACGWQIHPASEQAVPPDRGAFLFQRGVPALVELFVGVTDLGEPATAVALACGADRLPAVAGIRCVAGETAVTYRGRALEMV